jgi:putative acetyltransferase
LSAQQVWVALSGDDIAGFISLKPEGYLDFLYVGANFQRQSVASRLLFLLEKDALARGLTRIETHASEVAVPFFEAKGYRVVHANLAVANGISLANFLMETTLVS